LSGLHIDIIFEISCSGTTAAATNCEKGKTRAKQRDKKFTPLFEKLPSAVPPLQPVLTFLRCRSGGAAEGPKNLKKIVIFVKAVTKTGASVLPGCLAVPSLIFNLSFSNKTTKSPLK
jgi:hypothetical protein